MAKEHGLVTCALSGQQQPRTEMLRLVAMPSDVDTSENHHSIDENSLEQKIFDQKSLRWCVDQQGNLPGKHHWIFPKANIILDGDTQNLFQCHPQTLHHLLQNHVYHRVIQLLHGVRRSGDYCIGGDSIQQWWIKNSGLEQYSASILLLGARDGGSAKLWHYLRQHHGREANYYLHTQQELGFVFDKKKLGSVLIFNSGLCLKINQDMQHWQRLTSLD